MTGFPIESLPYGVFSTQDTARRVGVAIDDDILDLTTLELSVPPSVFAAGALNRFLDLGEPAWTTVRGEIADAVRAGDGARVRRSEATLHLPVAIGDYVDFYSSINHATNVGKLFRPQDEPLLPNWRHLPVGYHGRAGTIVVSGTDIHRPHGQRRGSPDPVFGPSNALDFELEVGFVTGNANPLGQPVPAGDAERHIFGICLVNDWSARDLQGWEYQPLGPFLSKSFATSISPWIVPLPALAGARVESPPQEPPVLPYLQTEGPTGLDLRLEVELIPAGADTGTVITRTSFADMYWTMAQQLAHATVNGATARAGDLFASGTVSGPHRGTLGCLLEITSNGADPLTLDDGSVRTYLEDGDTVALRGWAGEDHTLSLGTCVGTVVG